MRESVSDLMLRELEIGLGNEGLTMTQHQVCKYWLQNLKGLGDRKETTLKILNQLTVLNRVGKRIRHVEAQRYWQRGRSYREKLGCCRRECKYEKLERREE